MILLPSELFQIFRPFNFEHKKYRNTKIFFFPRENTNIYCKYK